jgi:hypothetical protein
MVGGSAHLLGFRAHILGKEDFQNIAWEEKKCRKLSEKRNYEKIFPNLTDDGHFVTCKEMGE